MKYSPALAIVLLVLGLTNIAQRPKVAPKAFCEPYVAERLESHFSRNAIRPAQVINNSDDEPNHSHTESIKIGRHTVQWIVSNEDRESRVSIRVNGNLITLYDKQSVNLTDGNQRLDMNIIGEWRTVKLYKLHNREIIALTMGPAMCTGLMCSVGAQVYYDASTRRSTFFGRYRTDHEAHLYQFSRHDGVYVIASNFDGDPHLGTSPAIVTYKLYKLIPDGSFNIERDVTGKEYWLRYTQYIERQKKPDRLDEHWIEKLN